MTRVETGARLHFGFQNLALAHDRLYGGVGLALAEPRLVIEAERATALDVDDPDAGAFARDVVDVLGVEGARLDVRERFPRHAGLGSGTQFALACLAAIAGAHDRTVDPRAVAPDLGRGGRSGVGVAAFERGGFVVDAGHPTERFTSAPPARGDWSVPRPVARHDVPEDWRFLLVTPDVPPGRSGTPEEESMRAVVERADPTVADEMATLLVRRVLPAVAEGDVAAFGRAIARLGRLNGAWYADEQGGVYRPPAGDIVEALSGSPAIYGAGQSSWGPTVYGVTTHREADRAGAVARDVLSDLGTGGTVRTVAPRNGGASLATDGR